MSQKRPQSPELLTASATHLALGIKSGEISSLDVVMAHQARLDQVNPVLNAMVMERREKALLQSSRSDAVGGPEPFRGVPCSIKECFAFTGMPQTSGLLRRKGILADHNATAVQRYLDAGAIPLGVSNTSELCMWMESDNLVYGRSNNPYDSRCTVGGSSGGEGALVGAGAVPFGLGSDIGGSIRMPAFFNGVFGHKPSGGLVPGTGQHPIAEGKALRYLSTGPICRKAEDLWPLLRILAGPDGQDEGCQPMELGDPGQVDLSKLRVLHIPDNGRQPVSDDLRQAQARMAQALQEAGAQVEELRIPAMKHGFDIWSSSLHLAGGTPFTTLMGDGQPVSPLLELLRLGVGRPQHTLMACMLGLTESLADLAPRRTRRFVQLGLELKAELEERLGHDGVLLYPSYTMPAPKHGLAVRRQLALSFDYAYTALLNIMEMPVTQVPLGLNAQGLPLGVQVGAAHGQDHLTVAVALWAEQAFGGWVPPWTR